MEPLTLPLDYAAIERILPHRYPFLLVDRIVEIEPGARVTGVKAVTANEPFFEGYGDQAMIMPGLLIIEAMAQTGAVLLMAGQEAPHTRVVYFAGVDRASWRGTVRPGDQLRLEIVVTRTRGRLSKVHGVARVESAVVCEADLAAVLVERADGASSR
jgi:3-hydroxyacyl-[acyl-carrier-protein] dehydratase